MNIINLFLHHKKLREDDFSANISIVRNDGLVAKW